MRRARVTGKAGRFLRLLQDFGHLDPHSIDEMLMTTTEMYGDDVEVEITVEMLRRVAASYLVESEELELNPVLMDDWPLVFS